MDVEKLNLSAIRTVRVLRPLRAINRIPSKFFNVLCEAFTKIVPLNQKYKIFYQRALTLKQ